MLNKEQARRKQALEQTIGRPVREIGSNEDCIFVEVEGITVTIGKSGAVGLPSIRSYDDGFDAAVKARSFWERQKRRDERNPERAQQWITGHLNPTVDVDWRCSGNVTCPCGAEDIERRKHRSFRKEING